MKFSNFYANKEEISLSAVTYFDSSAYLNKINHSNYCGILQEIGSIFMPKKATDSLFFAWYIHLLIQPICEHFQWLLAM